MKKLGKKIPLVIFIIVSQIKFSNLSAQSLQEVFFLSELFQGEFLTDTSQIAFYNLDLPAGCLSYSVQIKMFEDELPSQPELMKRVKLQPDFQLTRQIESGNYDFFISSVGKFERIQDASWNSEKSTNTCHIIKSFNSLVFSTNECINPKIAIGLVGPVSKREVFVQIEVIALIDEDLQMLSKTLHTYSIFNQSDQTLHFQLSQDKTNWFSVQIPPESGKDFFFSEPQIALKSELEKLQQEIVVLTSSRKYSIHLVPNSIHWLIKTYP